MKKFELFHNENYLWDLIFNKWSYEFILNPSIKLEEWNQKYWILPLKDTKELKNKDLFDQLNVRLPFQLRKSQNTSKLNFIEKSFLKVISDNYQLRPSRDKNELVI